MPETLAIRDEVVQSCIRDGRASQQHLESASSFAEGIADAAGTNGPLADTLRDAEHAWRIRREKLVETLTTIVDSVESINQAFEDADRDMSASLQGSTGDSGGAPTQASASDQAQSAGAAVTPEVAAAPVGAVTTPAGNLAPSVSAEPSTSSTAPTDTAAPPEPVPSSDAEMGTDSEIDGSTEEVSSRTNRSCETSPCDGHN